MNHVLGEEQGDARPRLLDGDALHLTRVRSAVHVEKRPDAARPNLRLSTFGHLRTGWCAAPTVLRELPQLLLERQLRQHRVDELLHRRIARCLM